LGVSARGLNTSLPSCLHPESIKRIFYPCPQRSLVLGWVSSLDAFSFYPVSRSRSPDMSVFSILVYSKREFPLSLGRDNCRIEINTYALPRR